MFKNKVFTFFAAIFCLFISINIVLIIIERPIIQRFREEVRNVQWTAFLILILLSAVLLLFTAKIWSAASYKTNKPILVSIVTAAAAIPRIVWINMINIVPQGDFGSYHFLASEMSKGNIVMNKYISLFPHVIGYPSVLSIFYKVFGPDITVAQYLNIILGCGIALILFFLGSAMWNEKCGFTAAMLWALWPSQILYSALVATEALYTFLLLLFILLFYHAVKSNKTMFTAVLLFGLLGFFASLINAIRPFGLIFLIATAIFYFIFSEESSTIRKRIPVKIVLYTTLAAAYFIGFYAVSQTISSAINQQVATSPIGFNVYVGANTKYSGAWNEEDSHMLTKLLQNPEDPPQSIHSKLLWMGIERFRSQNLFRTELMKEKLKTMWAEDYDILWYIKSAFDPQTPSSFNLDKYYNLLVKLCNYYYYTILLLCGFCSIAIIRNRERDFCLFITLIILGIAAVHMIVEVHGRYHYPVMSLFALLASYGMFSTQRQTTNS